MCRHYSSIWQAVTPLPRPSTIRIIPFPTFPKSPSHLFRCPTPTPTARFFYFFQYIPYIFLAILFAGMAPILVTLNSRDMKARTACSALPGRTRTLAMASGCLLYSSRHLAALSAAWSRILPESHAAALCRLCNLKQPRFPVFTAALSCSSRRSRRMTMY